MKQIAWDHALITDALSMTDIEEITRVTPKHPERTIVIIGHDVPTGTIAVAEKHKKLRAWAQEQKLKLRYGEGICYHLLIEDTLQPGEVVIGTGRQLSTIGAIGAMGLRLSPSDFAQALAEGTAMVAPSEALRIVLSGDLRPLVQFHDLALHITRYYEIAGKVIVLSSQSIPLEDRITICNLLAAAGAEHVAFAEKEAPQTITIDLDEVRPLAVLPGDFSRIVSSMEVDGVRVNQIFIGGCIGGGIESLRRAARIWKGKQLDPYVRAIVAPATAKVYLQALEEGLIETFLDANALVMNQGCSACWAQNMGRCSENEVFASTGSINSTNWAGDSFDGVYLRSVESVAQAALSGSLYEF